MPHVSRDNEVAASYIAKMIHLLGSDTSRAGADVVRLLGAVGSV